MNKKTRLDIFTKKLVNYYHNTQQITLTELETSQRKTKKLISGLRPKKVKVQEFLLNSCH